MITISVIIPTHNSVDTIERCIGSLHAQSFPREKFEIIVVDDDSKDKTVELITSGGVDSVIEISPCTAAYARNVGAKHARGDILAFIDSDCEAEKNWLDAAVKELQANQAITGPIENGISGNLVAWVDYLLEFSGFDKNRSRSAISFLPSCNMICYKKDFQKAGGFFEISASEDVLFGESLKNAGITPFFVPQLQIRHLCRTKMSKVLANQKLLGAHFIQARRLNSSLSHSYLAKSKWSIPRIFFGKIIFRAFYAVRSKKTLLFFVTFPLVVLGTASFCAGAWKEMES